MWSKFDQKLSSYQNISIKKIDENIAIILMEVNLFENVKEDAKQKHQLFNSCIFRHSCDLLDRN